ncbi:unnamed protein product [Orchesella dallaii]|uniref:G-protein coupled receptors family 1 profile domain-containing protein n=1 Tax=Orchesella dallaii TaxID=48710 RepID=A0ABP1Q1N1_9HEXA
MFHGDGYESMTLPIPTFSSSILKSGGLDYLSVGNSPIIETNFTSGSPLITASTMESESFNVTVNPYSGDGGDLYEVPLSIIIVLSLLYGGISATALIGNLLVLWIVMVSRRMRTVTNMFIANLALADIIIGLFAIPFQFQAALLQRWNLPDFMCAFCPFVQVLSVNVSVFTLSAIALDRYKAVLFPLSARVSKRKATWAILSIWSLGIGLALPTELDYKVIQIMDKGSPKPFCTNLGLSPTFRTYYTLGIVVVQYFFPLIIITGAYAHMATKLWGTTAPGNKEELRDAVVLRNKKKVIKMLALVVLLFALCWLPLQTYYFLQTLIPSINAYQYINIIWFCFHWLAMSNSCYNPFIYAIYNDKFQREFRTRLWCFQRWRRSGEDTQYSEASDFDRSKIRASFRFTNNRSMRQNHNSIYSSGRTTTTSEFRRNSSCHSRRSGLNSQRLSCDRTGSSPLRQTNICRLSPEQDSCAGGSSRYPSSGESRYCGGRCSISAMESNGARKESIYLDQKRRISESGSAMVVDFKGDSIKNKIVLQKNGSPSVGRRYSSVDTNKFKNTKIEIANGGGCHPFRSTNMNAMTVVSSDTSFRLLKTRNVVVL